MALNMNGMIASYLASPQGRQAIQNYLSSAEGQRMISEYLATPGGKDLIHKNLPAILAALAIPPEKQALITECIRSGN